VSKLEDLAGRGDDAVRASDWRAANDIIKNILDMIGEGGPVAQAAQEAVDAGILSEVSENLMGKIETVQNNMMEWSLGILDNYTKSYQLLLCGGGADRDALVTPSFMSEEELSELQSKLEEVGCWTVKRAGNNGWTFVDHLGNEHENWPGEPVPQYITFKSSEEDDHGEPLFYDLSNNQEIYYDQIPSHVTVLDLDLDTQESHALVGGRVVHSRYLQRRYGRKKSGGIGGWLASWFKPSDRRARHQPVSRVYRLPEPVCKSAMGGTACAYA